jgi:hypothetical protein
LMFSADRWHSKRETLTRATDLASRHSTEGA